MIEYSIIIPTYNRSDILKKCLQNICNLKKPSKNHEVLVIDNGSTDNTEETIQSFQNKIKNLRYFFDKTPGLHVGRHLGVREAKGNILCYLDDDSFVTKNWLVGIEKAFQKNDVVLAGGPDIPCYEQKSPGWLKYFWTETGFGKNLSELSLLDFGKKEKYIPTSFVYGCNFIIRKQTLIEFGGFHPDSVPRDLLRFRGDGETGLSANLNKAGIKAYYSPEIKIYHLVSKSRMTREYFEYRHYAQGISESFTRFRLENGIYSSSDFDFLAGFEIKNSCKESFLKEITGKFNDKIKKLRLKFDFNYKEYNKIIRFSKIKFNEGKQFHKNEVEKDSELLNYVLKKDYMN
jgi:glycosyltransferase involved in cell wall biosynthesis